MILLVIIIFIGFLVGSLIFLDKVPAPVAVVELVDEENEYNLPERDNLLKADVDWYVLTYQSNWVWEVEELRQHYDTVLLVVDDGIELKSGLS